MTLVYIMLLACCLQACVQDREDGEDAGFSPKSFIQVNSDASKSAGPLYATHNVVDPDDIWENNWDQNHTRICGDQEVIVTLRSKHWNMVEDRKWSVKCGRVQGLVVGHSCSWSHGTNYDQQWVLGDWSKVITGISSVHSDSTEDRIYQVYLCDVRGAYVNVEGTWHGWANNYDEYFSFKTESTHFLTRIFSRHSNSKEDRRFQFGTSKFKAITPTPTQSPPTPSPPTPAPAPTPNPTPRPAGNVYAVGLSDYTIPTLLATGMQTMAAGSSHAMFLARNGSVYAAGRNDYGQLGLPRDTTSGKVHLNALIEVEVFKGAVDLIAGGSRSWSSLVRFDNGTVFAAGELAKSGEPVEVCTGVQAMSTTGTRSLYLKNNGDVYEATENIVTPFLVMTGAKAVDARGRLILAKNNTVYALGCPYSFEWRNSGEQCHGEYSPQSIRAKQIMTGIQAMSSGGMHALLLAENNTLYASGVNDQGQLGIGGTPMGFHLGQIFEIATGVQAVVADKFNSYYLKTDGTVYGTGINYRKEVANTPQLVVFSPAKVATGMKAMSAGNGFVLLMA